MSSGRLTRTMDTILTTSSMNTCQKMNAITSAIGSMLGLTHAKAKITANLSSLLMRLTGARAAKLKQGTLNTGSACRSRNAEIPPSLVLKTYSQNSKSSGGSTATAGKLSRKVWILRNSKLSRCAENTKILTCGLKLLTVKIRT